MLHALCRAIVTYAEERQGEKPLILGKQALRSRFTLSRRERMSRV